jgi:NAD+ kinase
VRLSKVLLFHKRSTYQLQAVEYRDKRFIQLLKDEHEAVKRVEKAHTEHLNTLERLTTELKARNITVETKARSTLDTNIKDIDLLISVGGDGTFLDASQYLKKIPILGVNSAMSSSVGHFCLANETNMGHVLDQIMQDKVKPIELIRLEAILNGKVLPQCALNEILVAHKSPAGTSRYILNIDGHSEEQLSSGVWIGSPAGSTGALQAAGGLVMPITAREFQYVVREPYFRHGRPNHLIKGQLHNLSEVKMVSQMRTGAIFIDGQHLEYPFGIGDELIIKVSTNSLNAFIEPNINERFVNEATHKLTKSHG